MSSKFRYPQPKLVTNFMSPRSVDDFILKVLEYWWHLWHKFQWQNRAPKLIRSFLIFSCWWKVFWYLKKLGNERKELNEEKKLWNHYQPNLHRQRWILTGSRFLNFPIFQYPIQVPIFSKMKNFDFVRLHFRAETWFFWKNPKKHRGIDSFWESRKDTCSQLNYQLRR